MTGKIPKRKERPGIDRMGRTELHHAAASGDVDLVRTLLKGGANAGLPDDNLWTPLHFAAQANSTEIAVLLLDAGAPVDARESYGNTPLSTAVFSCKNGGGELITFLRSRGADPYLKNNHGVSPISLARSIANYGIKRFFGDLP